MTELGGRHARGEDRGDGDDRGVDHFLVDGVAPPVIGGDAATEYEPESYRDPPTTPIPTGTRDEPKPSWFTRVFKRP